MAARCDARRANKFCQWLGAQRHKAAIGGATVFILKDLVEAHQAGQAPPFEIAPMIVGFMLSFLVGYAAIMGLIKVLNAGKFAWFGYYVAVLAVLLFIF